jgi:hypothetical protein
MMIAIVEKGVIGVKPMDPPTARARPNREGEGDVLLRKRPDREGQSASESKRKMSGKHSRKAEAKDDK